MSKAFTREDDEEPAARPRRRRAHADLPAGVANYLTAEGAARLRAEADALPTADARRRALEDLLHTATIVPAPAQPPGEVVFGATVTLRTLDDDATLRFRLVGVDETDEARGWISWRSPLARTLLHAARGTVLTLPFAERPRKAEVVAIE